MKTKYLFPSRVSSLAKLNRLLLSEEYKNSSFYIVLDENTYNNCLPTLISHVSALEQAEFFEVPTGEEAKSLEVASQLWFSLLESGADRNSVIINLGGGCVTDLGGFVASGFKRGIRYINIPTTLIGMIDASIGGKTAVNMGNAKNQVGFFHQPEAVCIHPDFLNTLLDVHLECGIFEMAKTLLMCDYNAFKELVKASADDRTIPMDVITRLIPQCVDFKRCVIEADPTEKSIRKILNLGHTFGHAIESYLMDIDLQLPHGAAVGVGLKCELYLSVNKLGLDREVYDNLCRLLHSFVVVPKFSLRDTESIINYMRGDKKNRDGLILCVLLQGNNDITDTDAQGFCSPVIDVALDENEIRDALLKAGKF